MAALKPQLLLASKFYCMGINMLLDMTAWSLVIKFSRYCGKTIPPTFTSSGNRLFFKFHSDGSETHPGFLISYEMVTLYCSLTLCKEGEGGCSSDSECEGSLVCGSNNCANSTLQHCCTKTCSNDSDCLNLECNKDQSQCRLDSYSTNWSKCSQDSPCADGEGDCDDDTDCEGALLCGNDRCLSGPTSMDCCMGKFLKN